MAKITINGVDVVAGRNIVINGDLIMVDGVRVEGLAGITGNSMELRITEGTLDSLTTDRSVTCGAINGPVSAGGSVNSDDIKGDVAAGGSVNCNDITGNVKAGGSVNCDDVGGNVTATIVKRS